jgi:CheY-like chemotaxis protein
LKLLLTRLGYAVVSAESMAEALRAVDEGSFDLLVSDIGLPDGSGLDLMMPLAWFEKLVANLLFPVTFRVPLWPKPPGSIEMSGNVRR